MHARTTRATNLSIGCITFFVIVVITLPFVQQPGYDIVSQAISETALGRLGWLQDLAFCVLGVGALCLAYVLRRTTRTAVVGPLLLAVAGTLDFISAAFHTTLAGQPRTTASYIHQGAGMLTFALTILAIFATWRAFRRTPAWQPFARPTLVWACISAVCFIALGPNNFPDQFGITQRLMAASFISWMLVTSARARSAERPAAAHPDTDRYPLSA